MICLLRLIVSMSPLIAIEGDAYKCICYIMLQLGKECFLFLSKGETLKMVSKEVEEWHG